MFALCVPGLASLAGRELSDVGGLALTASGFDGRSDVVLFEAQRGRRNTALALRTTEDVFVEVGRTLRSEGDNPTWIAKRIWRSGRVERALSIWAEHVRPLAGAMTFRVVARVLQERSFVRTSLRDAFARVINRDRPKWRPGDPAQIEVWIVEHAPGQIVAGLRLSSAEMRQHSGREVERPGALRPTVAAAMVRLAGSPAGVLLDPCCGSGTILVEASSSRWLARGVDIDPDAVEIARRNARASDVVVGDARKLDLDDGSVAAVVSNLPFGRQYGVQGDMSEWLRTVLGELARVTARGGRVVLLVPQLPRDVVPRALRLDERHQLRLLGTKTTIWAFDRV